VKKAGRGFPEASAPCMTALSKRAARGQRAPTFASRSTSGHSRVLSRVLASPTRKSASCSTQRGRCEPPRAAPPPSARARTSPSRQPSTSARMFVTICAGIRVQRKQAYTSAPRGARTRRRSSKEQDRSTVHLRRHASSLPCARVRICELPSPPPLGPLGDGAAHHFRELPARGALSDAPRCTAAATHASPVPCTRCASRMKLALTSPGSCAARAGGSGRSGGSGGDGPRGTLASLTT
jgi:hypothetical protein